MKEHPTTTGTVRRPARRIAALLAAGALVTRVDFGASTAGISFDNAAGLNNVTLSKLSAIGVNGAFKSFDAAEIGSPGSIAAVPEPETYLMLLAGLAGLMWVRRSRR